MPPNHSNRSVRNRSPAAIPQPAEIRAAREGAGLTKEEAAALVYVGLRAWQRYETDKDSKEWRPMHPSMWELFRIKLERRAAEQVMAGIPRGP